MAAHLYGSDFYARQKEGSHVSARVILPLVKALCEPRSVVDVGCGVGTWLAAAREIGIAEIAGLEGEWVHSQTLMVDRETISPAALEQPLKLDRRYDLAVSLEVAEHLSPGRADSFVSDLCAASDVVLFSAATPGQDGDGHVNEQWPSYWAAKFARRGYVPLDLIRPQIASNSRVCSWYRTNILLFAKSDAAARIIERAGPEQLRTLDLPVVVEAEGLKRSLGRLAHYAGMVVRWGGLRLRQRLLGAVRPLDRGVRRA